MSFSADGTCIAAGFMGADSALRVWDAESGEEKAVCRGHKGSIMSMSFSPDGTRIVSGARGEDEAPRVWGVETGDEQAVLLGHPGKNPVVSFSRDGDRVVARSNGVFTVWDADTGQLVKNYDDASKFALAAGVDDPNSLVLGFAGRDETEIVRELDGGVVAWFPDTIPRRLADSSRRRFCWPGPGGAWESFIAEGTPQGKS